MAKTKDQKGKLLQLLRILWEESDETHLLSVPQLLERLGALGITAERKSIYDDISVLQALGYDIVHQRGRGYYLASRCFQLAELKLLVDAVQYSRFVTPRKSGELIAKLERQASNEQARSLQRQVYLTGQSKSGNETIYYTIDTIYEAINRALAISFRYFDYDCQREKVFRHEGAFYLVSPYALVQDGGRYYLVAYDDGAGQFRHYRVDKMESCTVTDQCRSGEALYNEQALGRYTALHFGMFRGREEDVLLRCERWMAGIMVDRFGEEISMQPDDDNHFLLTVRLVVSKQFYGWLVGLGNGVTIQAPAEVRGEMKAYLQEILQQY